MLYKSSRLEYILLLLFKTDQLNNRKMEQINIKSSENL